MAEEVFLSIFIVFEDSNNEVRLGDDVGTLAEVLDEEDDVGTAFEAIFGCSKWISE
jgi:hypothetical protein